MSWGAIFFWLLALILLAIAGGCVYEGYAIQFQKAPTISKIVAYQFATNPHLYMVGIFLAGCILGALVCHFTNWSVK